MQRKRHPVTPKNAVRLSRGIKPSAVKREEFEGDHVTYRRFVSSFSKREAEVQRRIYNIKLDGSGLWVGFVLLAVSSENLVFDTHINVDTEFIWIRPSFRGRGISSQVAGLAAVLIYPWSLKTLPRRAPTPWLISVTLSGKNSLGIEYVNKLILALEDECSKGTSGLRMYTPETDS